MYLSLRVERSETKQSQGVGIASLSLAMTQIILHSHLYVMGNGLGAIKDYRQL